jgi:hypothetical protein
MASNQEYNREKWIFIIIAFTSILAVAASVIFFIAITGGSLQRSTTVNSTGTVKGVGVGVYWDSGCTNQVSSINWGLVAPGSLNNETVYIRNEGTAPVTLSLTTGNWTTGASNYIALKWNYSNKTTIQPNIAIPVTLTLEVYPNIANITSFSFDIVITGSG